MVYPAGEHNAATWWPTCEEKVNRAALSLEFLEASGVDLPVSKPGAEGIGVPEP